MSIVSLDQRSEASWPAVDAAMSKIERKTSTPHELSDAEIQVAQEKGAEMIEHFTAFIEGKEDSFNRYFVTSSETHGAMHDGFWNELGRQYPGMVVLDFASKPNIRQYIFAEQKAALIARTDYAHDGEVSTVSGVNYEAQYLIDAPADVLGKLTTALAMQ